MLPLQTADLIKALPLTTATKVLTQVFTHYYTTGATCTAEPQPPCSLHHYGDMISLSRPFVGSATRTQPKNKSIMLIKLIVQTVEAPLMANI